MEAASPLGTVSAPGKAVADEAAAMRRTGADAEAAPGHEASLRRCHDAEVRGPEWELEGEAAVLMVWGCQTQ